MGTLSELICKHKEIPIEDGEIEGGWWFGEAEEGCD